MGKALADAQREIHPLAQVSAQEHTTEIPGESHGSPVLKSPES